jgi:hypothetical protein
MVPGKRRVSFSVAGFQAWRMGPVKLIELILHWPRILLRFNTCSGKKCIDFPVQKKIILPELFCWQQATSGGGISYITNLV